MKYSLVLLLSVAAFGQTLAFGQLKTDPQPNPSKPGSLQANWSVTPEGNALLSWIEAGKPGLYTLKYSVRKGNQWSDVHTVASDRHFFRHPAEVPEVITMSDGSLMAHWIEQPNEKSEAEFAYVSASKDGVKWTTPIMAHADKSDAQHGLASIVQSGPNEASLLWLEALKGEDGPTSLKRSVISGDGKLVKEETLDKDTCSCCPTAVVKTTKGLLVAYRDHTPADIRDIATIRFEGGKWLPSKIINADNWKIDACPVNAAAVAVKGDHVAVSWFTGAQDKPRTQIAFSADSGTTFGKPVLVSTGHSYGYTSLVMDAAGNATVSWLEQGGDAARILVRTVSSAGVAGPVLQVAAGGKSSLAYPKMASTATETWIAWGDNKADSKLQTVRIVK